MKESELKVPSNPTHPEGTFAPENPQTQDHSKCEEALDRKLSINRQAFGGPLQPEGADNPRRKDLLGMEYKAESGCTMDDSDGQK